MRLQRRAKPRFGLSASTKLRALALLWMCSTGLAGCGLPGDDLPPVVAAASGEYRLGPGDEVKITTFGEQQLTGLFHVGDTGKVALPLVGSIDATGKTPFELAANIAKTLSASKLYLDPKVTAEVTSYRPIFILGEVSKPGQYPFQPGMTVVTAVAVAGGFTYRAVTSQFSIVRTIDGTATEGKAERQAPVQPGDVITVFERLF